MYHKYTDGAAVGGSKYAAAGPKVAGAPLGSCRFVSMDATAKPSFGYGSRLTLVAERLNHHGHVGPTRKRAPSSQSWLCRSRAMVVSTIPLSQEGNMGGGDKLGLNP